MKSKTASVPYGIWMTIFIVVPMILVVVFAFTDKSGHFTLDNIMAVGQYSNVFLRSIWLGAIATVICLVSACLHYFAHRCACTKCADYVGHAADVDEFFASHLCMDDVVGG